MIKYILFIILILICLYVYSYYLYPKNEVIIQTTLNNFKLDMLLEKQPIIIQDNIVNLNQIIDAWFKYNSNTKFVLNSSESWNKNKYKYLLFKTDTESEIIIYSPTKKLINGLPDTNEKLTLIKMSEGQILILPFNWLYNIQSSYNLNCVGINDFVTNLLP